MRKPSGWLMRGRCWIGGGESGRLEWNGCVLLRLEEECAEGPRNGEKDDRLELELDERELEDEREDDE